MTLVIRAALNPTSLIADVRGIVHSVDPNQPLGAVHSMQNTVSEFVAPQRVTMLIAGLFATLALLLAMVGLYGVLSYSVARRSHEFGIRMALGAAKGDILRLIVAQGFRLALVGIVVGWRGSCLRRRQYITVAIKCG